MIRHLLILLGFLFMLAVYGVMLIAMLCVDAAKRKDAADRERER